MFYDTWYVLFVLCSVFWVIGKLRFLFIVRCLKIAVCWCLVFGVRCVLFVICCLLFADCCAVFVVVC